MLNHDPAHLCIYRPSSHISSSKRAIVQSTRRHQSILPSPNYRDPDDPGSETFLHSNTTFPLTDLVRIDYLSDEMLETLVEMSDGTYKRTYRRLSDSSEYIPSQRSPFHSKTLERWKIHMLLIVWCVTGDGECQDFVVPPWHLVKENVHPGKMDSRSSE